MPEVVHANCRLFDHVIMPYLHGAQQEIPYRTLCKLLPDLINGSSLASATTIALLRTSSAPAGWHRGCAGRPTERCAGPQVGRLSSLETSC